MKEETEAEVLARIKNATDQALEHLAEQGVHDARIFCGVSIGDETHTVSRGKGNYFAQRGMIGDWMIRMDRDARDTPNLETDQE